MRIYEQFTIDMETLKTLDEVSYEYEGPIALCGDGGGGGDGGTIGDAGGQFSGSGLGDMSSTGTPTDGGPGFGGPPGQQWLEQPRPGQAVTAASVVPESTSVLDDFDLEELLGGSDDIFLSDEEVSYLDEIEANRVTMLTDAINEQVYDIQQKDIADLVSRGVLQGDVGATTLAKTRDNASKAIEEGTLSIGTQRMQDELNYLSQKRDFSLKEDYLKWDMNKFITGLEWQTEQSELDRAFQERISRNLEDAASDASGWNLFGNIVGGTLETGLDLFF